MAPTELICGKRQDALGPCFAGRALSVRNRPLDDRLSDTSQHRETPKLPRRSILAARQRTCLFDLPTDKASLLKHYTLADDDIEHVRERRRPENQLGFALQLGKHKNLGVIVIE